MKGKYDIFSGLVIAVIGIVFMWQTYLLEGSIDEVMEVMLLPRIISIMLLCFGLLLSVKTLLSKEKPSSSATSASPMSPQLLCRLGLLATMGFAYTLFFWLFGYLIATIIVAIPVFYIFGNRGWFTLLVLPILAAIIIHLVFFKTMGLYQAPAAIFSFF